MARVRLELETTSDWNEEYSSAAGVLIEALKFLVSDVSIQASVLVRELGRLVREDENDELH